MKLLVLTFFGALMFPLGPAQAAELVLPQNRNAFFSREPVELAVAGLPAGQTAKVEIVSQQAGIAPLTFDVDGDGSTLLVSLPPYALAAGEYRLRLDAKDSQQLIIASGTNVSPMLLSQTIGWNDLQKSGANFVLGNAFSFGLLTPDGKPLVEGLRERRSAGLTAFEQAIGMDLPTICYMYWTGYVTHKPWGSEKSWADPKMIETMRLFNFHTAQRLRRYREAIVSVGCLDEPGLGWGKTPAGGTASGFPDWDERQWYESRGWQYTPDIASRDDADWMRYMTIRCAILKESMDQAKRDLKTVWPEMVFSTDLYAPHAIMDGTDPMNQEVNEIPSTHVFVDWGYGKLGVIGALYLEKAHQPTAKIAHAMNGQLFGKPVPQPGQRDAYRLMLNALLAAGLQSNWWLNTGGMTPDDLAGINEPGQRLGPLFLEMSPEKHDVAVLWSFTEIAMREKAIAAKEAQQKKTGEKIKLMVASLPENTALKEGQIELSAYSVGGNYKEQVLSAHQALSRAGYPAHIVDERLLARALPRQYKTLVIVGQTFDLPMYVKQAISDFSNAGGRVVIDRTTTVRFDDALVTEADFKDPAYRWTPLFLADKKSFRSPREASYFQTNYFMDELARQAVEPLKKTMRETPSKPAITTDSVHLAAERHVGGEGQILMVLNGFERLPDVAESDEYPIYNYSDYEAEYTLEGIDPSSVVYLIEGADWRKERRITDFDRPQKAHFAPGEMKLYLVAPRKPGWWVGGDSAGGSVTLWAEMRGGVKMPWPLEVTVSGPDGRAVYHVYRATNEQGRWQETFAFGTNARPGIYKFKLKPLAGHVGTGLTFDYRPQLATPRTFADKVRVFDETPIRDFLAGKPEVRIAIGGEAQRPAAEKLQAAMTASGVPAHVVAESEIIRKARYPRVWDPYIKIHKPQGAEQQPPAEVKFTATIESADDGRQVAHAADGNEVSEWRKPGTLLHVAGNGFIDFDVEKFYEPGCVLFIRDDNQVAVRKGEPIEVASTDEVRQKWSRPWTRLNSFVGTDKLCPQLPEAYTVDSHLILFGDSKSSELAAALQASDLLLEVADEKYPGSGKALVSFVWSPFAVEKNVIFIGASDGAGVDAGIGRLAELAR